MAEYTAFKCDVCGATKGEANHWFYAIATRTQFHVAPFVDRSDLARRYIGTEGAEPIDLCSEQCVAKAMSKTIGAGV